MSYRKTTTWSIAIALLGIGLLVTSGHADLNNDTFTSQRHKVTLSRPDASWELRDNPAQDHAVALFSNGEGKVIALLIHEALPASDVLTSPDDLKSRWPELSSRITQIANGGSSGVTIEFSEHKLEPSSIVFDIVFTGNSPYGGEPLRSWVSGMIIRDNSGRQHIYGVCCAAPQSSFGSWEGQFERIGQSLSFTGQKNAAVFTSPPAPRWWWLLGGVLLLVVFLVARQLTAKAKHSANVARMDATSRKAPTFEDMGAGMGSFAGAGDNTLQPMPLEPASDTELSNVPDQFLAQQHHASEEPHEHGALAATATATGDSVPDGESPANFWKCRCGRMNPLDDAFCARCNLDKPKKD